MLSSLERLEGGEEGLKDKVLGDFFLGRLPKAQKKWPMSGATTSQPSAGLLTEHRPPQLQVGNPDALVKTLPQQPVVMRQKWVLEGRRRKVSRLHTMTWRQQQNQKRLPSNLHLFPTRSLATKEPVTTVFGFLNSVVRKEPLTVGWRLEELSHSASQWGTHTGLHFLTG